MIRKVLTNPQPHLERRLSYTEPVASSAWCGNRPWTASSTQMSSSNSSQRRARPWRRSCNFSKLVWLAEARSGYLAAGKLTRRWSVSSRHTRRPSIQQRTARAVADCLSSMESNIGGFKHFAMLLDQTFDITQFRSRIAEVSCKIHGSQPKFGLQIITGHVNMRRFVSFAAIEVKPVRTYSEHRWHAVIFYCGPRVSSHCCSRLAMDFATHP